jgi:hypothetical protein
VQDAVNTATRAGNGVGIGEINSQQINFRRYGCEILAAACGEVVETADVVATGDEALRKMRADEACNAGDEIGGQVIKFRVFLLMLRIPEQACDAVFLDRKRRSKSWHLHIFRRITQARWRVRVCAPGEVRVCGAGRRASNA